MDNIKSIISNNEGQRDYNLLPPSIRPATFIKGKKGDTPITMKGIQYPMIALDKYGVNFQQPDQEYNYKSKGVLEIPYMPGSNKKDEEMNKAQQGGTQAEQFEQLIMMYAQLTGADPQKLAKQIQALPPEKQNEAFTAMAQALQQAQQEQMAQQQQGAGPEQQQAMMGQEGEEDMMGQEMGMARYGGLPKHQGKDGNQVSSIDNTYISPINTKSYDLEQYPSSLEQYYNIAKNIPALTWEKLNFDIPINVYSNIGRAGEKVGLTPNQEWFPLDTVRYNPYLDKTENRVDLNLSPSEYELKLLKDAQNKRWNEIRKTGTFKEKGGEPCFDCYDHYNPSPQAQDLNWFYKKQGGPFSAANTYPTDWASYSGNQYQKGRQTGKKTPNYEPNWFARRTSVPGQVLGAIGNTLPYFGSIMGKGIHDIAFNGGKPAYVPNTDITYDDLSYYMMNRRYLNQDPNSRYDKIIQNLTPEELEQISGPMFKDGGEAFPAAVKLQDWFGGDRSFMFQKGGSLYDYAKSLGIDPSYASRKKMFSKYFNEEYTGTAEQNTYLLNALKSGKIKAQGVHPEAERPRLGQPSVPYSIGTPSAGSSKQTKVQPKKTETPKKTEAPKKNTAPVQTVQQPLQYQWSAGYTNTPKDNLLLQSPYMDKVVSTPTKKTTTTPKKTETKKVNTSADQRQIPQTGVIVDKRTGEAIVLGNTNTMKFPVLTGAAGADANVRGVYANPYDIPVNERVTPRGYYMMMNQGNKENAREYDGNIKLLKSIPAFGMPAYDYMDFINQSNGALAMHQTWDPAFREQFYNMSPEERYRSYGCVNCQKPNYLGMMETLNNQNDTVFVVDSKLPQDAALWNQAQQQFETRPGNPIKNYTAIATERELGGQSDIHRAYQMMKEGGFDMNPKKKKGGKFNHLDAFNEYLQKGGGLSMAQKGTTVGDYSDPFGSKDWTYTKGPNGWIAYNQGKAINMFGSPKWTTDPKLMGSIKALDDTWAAMQTAGLSGASGWDQTVQGKLNKTNKTSTDPFDAGNITSPQPDLDWNMNDQGVNALVVHTPTSASSNDATQQYVGKLPSDGKLGVKYWGNKNIKKIKGTPNRPVPNIGWNTPGAAYMQGAMNSKLFGTSGLGMALSTLTGALDPNAALLGESSPFKAKYRRDGSLRKVKGSASDVNAFFNPNAGTTDNTTTTNTTSNTSGATTTNTSGATTTGTTTPNVKGFGSSLFSNNSSDINDLRRNMMGDYRNQVYLQNRKNTMGFAHGGAYHYLPMALMGIPPIDDSLEGSPDYQASTGNQQQDSNVRVRTTDNGGFGVNKRNAAGMEALAGAAQGTLNAAAANRKQDQYNTMQENMTAMSNPANYAGTATPTQFGSYGSPENDRQKVFPNGPVASTSTGANYGITQLYNNNQITRDGGSIYDRYEEGGEYDLTDEEIEEILAAGGSVEYI